MDLIMSHLPERINAINKELLLEKIYSELNEVIEKITQITRADRRDEIIPILCGWELALKWTIEQIEELEEESDI